MDTSINKRNKSIGYPVSSKWEAARDAKPTDICINCGKTKDDHGKMGYSCISVKPGMFEC